MREGRRKQALGWDALIPTSLFGKNKIKKEINYVFLLFYHVGSQTFFDGLLNFVPQGHIKLVVHDTRH